MFFAFRFLTVRASQSLGMSRIAERHQSLFQKVVTKSHNFLSAFALSYAPLFFTSRFLSSEVE